MTPHADIVSDAALTAAPSGFVAPPPPIRAPGDAPDVTVYGYWPYWGDPLDTLQWDQLTHVALFDVGLTASGALANTDRWTDHAATAMALAQPWGVRVHLTVTSFSDTVMDAVLADPGRRAIAIAELTDLVQAYGAHGVNVDFEGLDPHLKPFFVQFVEELSASVDEVYLATPAIDWLGAYDYDELALASDGLFIMGYGYHWSGGNPGPVAPLDGGGPWGPYSLSWTVDDYRRWGATDDKIVLGMPLYGRTWPTTDTSIPGTATGTGTAVVYSSTAARSDLWDAVTHTAYRLPSATSQQWYDNADSLEIKSTWAVDEGLQGIGFWALTYDNADPELWQRLDAITHLDSGPGVGTFDPGVAGVINTVQFHGATPLAEVTLVVGWSPGAPVVPGCSETLAFGNPLVLGTVQADSRGTGSLNIWVPPAAAGRVIQMQAVERTTCEVGAPSTTAF